MGELTTSGLEVERAGDRVNLTVSHNGEMVVQFRLTDEQALTLAGRLMRAAGKAIMFDEAGL